MYFRSGAMMVNLQERCVETASQDRPYFSPGLAWTRKRTAPSVRPTRASDRKEPFRQTWRGILHATGTVSFQHLGREALLPLEKIYRLAETKRGKRGRKRAGWMMDGLPHRSGNSNGREKEGFCLTRQGNERTGVVRSRAWPRLYIAKDRKHKK